jgi:hypothetical protein
MARSVPPSSGPTPFIQILETSPMRLIPLSLFALAVAAGPALAGPVGSGLAHTEEVARKAAAEKAAVRLTAPSACLGEAKAALAAAPGVRKVAHDGQTLVVHVKNPGPDAPALQQVVDGACASGARAS